jgi:hypothetical protein
MNNINVKNWYVETYPTDELGQDINPEIEFTNVLNTLDNYSDIYDLIGVGDSIIRERLFQKLSQITGQTYTEIYDKWREA